MADDNDPDPDSSGIVAPFGSMSISNPAFINIGPIDVMRFNQHPPKDAGYSCNKLLRRMIFSPYYFSGHIIDTNSMVLSSDHHTIRYGCTDVLDDSHGVLQVYTLPNPSSNTLGYIEQSLLCQCSITSGEQMDNRFFSIFEIKYETRLLAAYAFV